MTRQIASSRTQPHDPSRLRAKKYTSTPTTLQHQFNPDVHSSSNMALPLPSGITPPEIAFLCEMELVTVVPRQRLESLDLLSVSYYAGWHQRLYKYNCQLKFSSYFTHISPLKFAPRPFQRLALTSTFQQGPTAPLRPPQRTPLPLWLALLLHRQRRANILPPPWLSAYSLTRILEQEIANPDMFSSSPPWPSSSSARDDSTVSPPFIHSSTADAQEGYLPYHWVEIGELLLTACGDDIPNSSQVRGLLRDLREIRQSKLRAGMKGLEGGGVVSLRGVGAMEVASERGFVVGVVGGLRALGASREANRREREADGGENGDGEDDDGSDMEL